MFLHNETTSTFEHVVNNLSSIFEISKGVALAITSNVHYTGSAIVFVGSKKKTAKKAAKLIEAGLQISVEPAGATDNFEVFATTISFNKENNSIKVIGSQKDLASVRDGMTSITNLTKNGGERCYSRYANYVGHDPK